jgi:hypothetical protein
MLGASLYGASAVKTDFTEAQLDGTTGPFFPDRAPGLAKAVTAMTDPGSRSRLQEYLSRLEAALQGERHGST